MGGFMPEYTIGEIGKINSWANEVDYHAGQLQELLTDNPEQDEDYRSALELSVGETGMYDIAVRAHHRSFILRYRHVIRDQDGRAALFGNFQLFEIDSSYLKDVKLKEDSIFSFDIDPTGGAKINGSFLSCSPNPAFKSQDRKGFKKQILFAIQCSFVTKN
jgi:hypothetical protein